MINESNITFSFCVNVVLIQLLPRVSNQGMYKDDKFALLHIVNIVLRVHSFVFKVSCMLGWAIDKNISIYIASIFTNSTDICREKYVNISIYRYTEKIYTGFNYIYMEGASFVVPMP